MIKNVHLGIFISEYDKKPYLYRDLKTFADATELDRFMDYFNNNNKDVRIEFNEDISEYFLNNIQQINLVEDVTNKQFNGRLCAFYYDDNNNLQFLELPKPGKVTIRDFRIIPRMEDCVKYLWDLFDEVEKKLKKKYDKTPGGPPKGAFLGIMCEKFRQVSYEFSDEELHDLRKYYDAPTEYNRKVCLRLIRTNVRRFFLAKAQKEYAEKQKLEQIQKDKIEYSEDEHLYQSIIKSSNEKIPKDELSESSIPEFMQYCADKAIETGDDDYLYLNYDLDELDKYQGGRNR